MDLDEVKELIELMLSNDLSEISVKDGDKEISLRRGSVSATVGSPTASPSPPPPEQPVEAPAALEPEEGPGLVEIKSPMVGTVYAAPSPETPPFVDVGSQVTPDTVVCIVEAMKVMNEIKADISGTVVKVLVDNREAVEFGQPLFLVRPQ